MKSFIRNKKGDGDTHLITSKWLYYIIVIILVSFIFIFFLSGTLSLIDARTDAYWSLEKDIFTAHLVNVCFSYVEDEGESTERRYQNVLDVNKLTLEHLERCTTKGTYILVTNLADTEKTYELKLSKSTPGGYDARYTLLKDGEHIYPAKIEVRI